MPILELDKPIYVPAVTIVSGHRKRIARPILNDVISLFADQAVPLNCISIRGAFRCISLVNIGFRAGCYIRECGNCNRFMYLRFSSIRGVQRDTISYSNYFVLPCIMIRCLYTRNRSGSRESKQALSVGIFLCLIAGEAHIKIRRIAAVSALYRRFFIPFIRQCAHRQQGDDHTQGHNRRQ